MQVTLDIKELLIGLVLIALFVLLIMLIVVLKNLIPSLKKLNLVLGDANRITTVAANKTEQLDGVLDEAVRAVHSAFGLDAEDTEAVVYGGTGR